MAFTVDRLLQPHPFSEFVETYYEKQHLLIKRQSPAYYGDLLTLDTINDHLGQANLSSTGIRLHREGEPLDQRSYIYDSSSPHSRSVRGAIDKDSLFARFYEGYTIVIAEFERHSAAILRLRHELERRFHAPALGNIYLTPRNARGFNRHWDLHDTFILQVVGSKEWTVYDSPIRLPGKRQQFVGETWTPTEPVLKATLEQGDLLYMPRGFVHEARSGSEVSAHLTMGVYTSTYADLLRAIADNADADPWLRQSLPIEYASTRNDEFLRHVHQFLDLADVPSYVARMRRSFTRECLPDAQDRLRDYVSLPHLDPTTRLRIRSVVHLELVSENDDAILKFNKKALPVSAAAVETVRSMIEMREFEMGALHGNPADNLALCSTLIREGLLSIVG